MWDLNSTPYISDASIVPHGSKHSVESYLAKATVMPMTQFMQAARLAECSKISVRAQDPSAENTWLLARLDLLQAAMHAFQVSILEPWPSARTGY